LWEFFGKSFPFDSKNMILHGAPGTGKTYSVENSIKQKLSASVDGDTDKYYTLVQFHPSFGYEEFIDGIKPSGLDENGQMKFELVDGVFKKMCIDAANELVNNPKSPKNFYFIADEINRAELSRVFGEVLLCLEEDKRLSYKNGKWEGTKIEVLNSGLWTRDSQAVIVENGRRYFGVPTNIYFIGTMNDIDRSVDSFDMALRRRFLWRHYQCDYSVLEDEYFNDSNLEDYITICKALNEHIISPKGYDLGESYQLGHSYFMKPSKLTKVQLTLVWVNYIKPLLREYLRSSVSVGQIESKLKEAERIYRLPTEK